MKRVLVGLSLLLSMFAVLAFAPGCPPPAKPKGDNSGKGATRPPVDPSKEIRIGVIYPMSGGLATFGGESWTGLQISGLDGMEINGATVVLYMQDDEGDAGKARDAAKKLLEQKHCIAIIGSVTSGNTMAIAGELKADGIPVLTSASTKVTITKDFENVVRACFHDDYAGDQAAQRAAQLLAAKNIAKTDWRAAVMIEQGSPYSDGLGKAFAESFQKLGGTIVYQEVFQKDPNSFDSLISAVKAKNPTVIFIPGYYEQVGPMLNKATDAWAGKLALGGDGWDSPELKVLSGSALDKIECYCVTHFVANDPAEQVQAFVRDFKAADAKHQLPGAMAGLGYDAGKVMADALKRASTAANPVPTSAAILEALKATKNVAGVTGVITIGPDRNAIKPSMFARCTRQGFELVK